MRLLTLILLLVPLGACSAAPDFTNNKPPLALVDEPQQPVRPAIREQTDQDLRRAKVDRPDIPEGTIVINTGERWLYLGLGNGKAMRYGIGVGKDGMDWKSVDVKVGTKQEWPEWIPPQEMRERELHKKDHPRVLPERMQGGVENPLGARAIYLYGTVMKNGRVVGSSTSDTLYRIHGTNAPETIGKAMSSGCFRMMNEDVIDLYARVPKGTKVTVL